MGQPAARQSDDVAHKKAAGPILEGSTNVLIGKMSAARLGDKVKHDNSTEAITEGESTVLINGKHAARLGDKVSCSGIVIGGCMTVHIGRDKDEACLLGAAEQGAMVVESGI
ncbi:MAG: hypothetical protein NVS3B3_23790 [Aquirhabdus sp.]